jgi:hypothetical protein
MTTFPLKTPVIIDGNIVTEISKGLTFDTLGDSGRKCTIEVTKCAVVQRSSHYGRWEENVIWLNETYENGYQRKHVNLDPSSFVEYILEKKIS